MKTEAPEFNLSEAGSWQNPGVVFCLKNFSPVWLHNQPSFNQFYFFYFPNITLPMPILNSPLLLNKPTSFLFIHGFPSSSLQPQRHILSLTWVILMTSLRMPALFSWLPTVFMLWKCRVQSKARRSLDGEEQKQAAGCMYRLICVPKCVCAYCKCICYYFPKIKYYCNFLKAY